MDQQNRKTIRKKQEVKVREGVKKSFKGKEKSFNIKHKVNLKKDVKPVKETVEKKTEEKTEVKVSQDSLAFGQKLKVINDVSTIDGTLHKDEIVRLESVGLATDFRVVDNMGRVWSVNMSDLSRKI